MHDPEEDRGRLVRPATEFQSFAVDQTTPAGPAGWDPFPVGLAGLVWFGPIDRTPVSLRHPRSRGFSPRQTFFVAVQESIVTSVKKASSHEVPSQTLRSDRPKSPRINPLRCHRTEAG
jgi:hypothetical protein